MDMFEMDDPVDAFDKYTQLIVEERRDPTDIKKYLQAAMKAWPEYLRKNK